VCAKPLSQGVKALTNEVFLKEVDGHLDAMGRKFLPPKKKVRLPTDPIQSCRKCYFCSGVRVFGVDWYVKCTNVARSASTRNRGRMWTKAEVNLSCWREP
jgi:hypothetical protein